MEQFKPAKVIMLHSKYESKILKLENSLLFNNITTKYDVKSLDKNECFQHLYIISDDKIKDGDWFYDSLDDRVSKAERVDENVYTIFCKDNCSRLKYCKKIIATTDTSLIIGYTVDFNSKEIYLPQPSQQFIEKYIESYNKSEAIIDVLVEYETKCSGCGAYPATDMTYCTYPVPDSHNRTLNTFIKINLDNTITIKQMKNSWNREELQPLKDYYEHSKQFVRSNDYREQDVQKIFKWIEENL